MATTYKVLGQALTNPANTNTLYTVPASTQAVVSTINVCNLGSTQDTVRIAIRVDGATLGNSQYIIYDLPLAAKATFTYTAGITLGDTDVITVYSTTGDSSFSAFGSEIA